MKQTSEAAFESAIETVLLADGYHQELHPAPSTANG